MKKRTYTLPILIALFIIGGIVLLAYFLTLDPYQQAIKQGDSALENQNYTSAVSQYTIAQNIEKNNVEAYHKAITAIALANTSNTTRDMLTTINNCIEFCGIGSVSPKQITDAVDILLQNGNTESAYDILNHLHFSLAEDESIKSKLSSLNTDTPAPVSTPEPTPVPTPVSEITTPVEPVIPVQSPAPVQTATPTLAPVSTPAPTPLPTAEPTVQPTPQTPEETSTP